MAKKFDREQTQAIEITGTDVLVSASAGAGKTGVLVERLTKRAVKDRIPISRIVAMTFTQAAAEEMKKRLASRLNEEYSKAETDEEKTFLKKQLAQLQSADITTIDSYCLTIIKKYYSVIGLDPKTTTNILDEGTANLYRKEAFFSVISDIQKNSPDQLQKLLIFFSPRSEEYDSLFSAIENINRNAQAGMAPSTWYAEAVNNYRPIRSLNNLDDSVHQAFFNCFLSKMECAASFLDQMENAAVEDKKVKPETLVEERNLITNCSNHLKEFRWSSFLSSLESLVLHTTTASTANKPYSDARKKLEAQKKELLAQAYPEEILIQDHNDMYTLVSLLVDIAQKTWDRFMEIKRIHACMDFTDMERFAYEILIRNNGTVASILRESLDEILVDEFQDTSELQNAVITAISNGHNVFRVGDVKQSIYRFRQAKPELMRSLMHDPNTCQITLRHNYRSKDSIVQFTNLLFSKVMNIEGCEDTYSDLDTVTIGENNAYQMEEKLKPVVFAYLPKEAMKENDPEGFSAKKAKADWISAKILAMKKEDPSLKFSDFAILVRSHADKSVIRTSFDSYNIPYDIDGREGFFQSSLAQTIFAMVHVMLDPSDSLHLLAVLTSSFCHYSDEQIAAMKIQYGSVVKGVRETDPEFFSNMEKFRLIATEQSVVEMLNAIACTNHFYDRLSSKDKANFDFLFEKMSNATCNSLFAFLDTMEASQDEKSSEAMSRGKDDDAVIATTIHQSKGLQYKIVFLWGSSANRFNDASETVVINDRLKLGISHLSDPYRTRRPTIERMAVEYQSNIEDAQEFVRLLYVAVTRAEQRLFLVDCLKEPFSPMNMDRAFLLARKGITGTMDIPLQNEPLYRTVSVDLINRDKAEALPQKYASSLPVFHTMVSLIEKVSTPSSLEVNSLPPLDLNGHSSGKKYGTRIHEVMELLPNTMWTKETLSAFNLNESEEEHILRFSLNPLYAKALNMHIEKEFPFYIDTDELHTTGAIDFLAYNEKEALIIDFKTDHASLNEIQSRYKDQLLAYKKAVSVLFPDHEIHVYAYSFHNDCEIKIL